MRVRSLPLCTSSALVTALALFAGCLWARLAISEFQRREGRAGLSLSSSTRAADYEFWGISLPFTVTVSCAVLVGIVTMVVLWRRRDIFSLLALSGCFFIFALVWMYQFASLSFEAFD